MPREAKAKQLEKDYADTFGSEHGQRVLHHLMDTCHLFTPLMGHPERDAMEGQRSMVLGIIQNVRRGKGTTPEQHMREQDAAEQERIGE